MQLQPGLTNQPSWASAVAMRASPCQSLVSTAPGDEMHGDEADDAAIKVVHMQGAGASEGGEGADAAQENCGRACSGGLDNSAGMLLDWGAESPAASPPFGHLISDAKSPVPDRIDLSISPVAGSNSASPAVASDDVGAPGAIAAPSKSNSTGAVDITTKGKLGNQKPTTKSGVTVPIRAVLLGFGIVVLSMAILVAVVPLMAGWTRSFNQISLTATKSLETELEALRNTVVTRAKNNITAKLNEPVMFINQVIQSLLTQNDLYCGHFISTVHWAFHVLLKPVFDVDSKDFSNANLGWLDSNGEHVLSIQSDMFGVYDSATSSNVTYYLYDGIFATNLKTPRVTTNYNLTARPWWITAYTSTNTLVWTSVYTSLIMNTRVISLTGKLNLSLAAEHQEANATNTSVCLNSQVLIQCTMSIGGLSAYFASWNSTPHGAAFLMEDSTRMIAGSPGISVQDASGVLFANQSNIGYVISQWLNLTAGLRIPHSFIVNSSVFVDITSVEEEGGLVVWLVLLTPSVDFMDNLVKENQQSLKAARMWMGIVVSSECVLGILVLSFGVIFITLLGHTLRRVVRQLKQVSDGEFDCPRQESSYSVVSEIFDLQCKVKLMRNALDAFSKYVPTDTVKHLCHNGMVAEVGVQKCYCTVFFLDVVDFTKMMDEIGSEIVIPLLHLLFESFTGILVSNKAIIDKYIGDAIMAVWGALDKVEDSEFLACKSALEIQSALHKHNELFCHKIKTEVRVRIGIHSGICLAGNVGCSHRLNFTVIGNTVNLAARLEPLNKELATSVCVSSSVRAKCYDRFLFRALGHLPIRGFQHTVLVHELLGWIHSTTKLSPAFLEIDELLLQGKGDVRGPLENYLQDNPEDEVARNLLKLHTEGKLH
ncbi:adenylate cyclase [Pelomyxa schiedti]|nr:adenylate cyclase [Pelomyxa schiedti]